MTFSGFQKVLDQILGFLSLVYTGSHFYFSLCSKQEDNYTLFKKRFPPSSALRVHLLKHGSL